MSIPAMGMLPGGKERVGEHEGREGYLRVVSVDAGVAKEELSTGAVARVAMAAALSPAAR